jgi:hypothetical protein
VHRIVSYDLSMFLNAKADRANDPYVLLYLGASPWHIDFHNDRHIVYHVRIIVHAWIIMHAGAWAAWMQAKENTTCLIGLIRTGPEPRHLRVSSTYVDSKVLCKNTL